MDHGVIRTSLISHSTQMRLSLEQTLKEAEGALTNLKEPGVQNRSLLSKTVWGFSYRKKYFSKLKPFES